NTSMPSVAPGGTYTNLQPTYAKLQNATIPAFRINGGSTVLAGDADGDGVADCLLSRIPGVSADSLTWYFGVRIIDNNSAINANTAWSRDQEFPIDPNAPLLQNCYGLFQTGVGLQELIDQAHTGEKVTALTDYRFNHTPANATPY